MTVLLLNPLPGSAVNIGVFIRLSHASFGQMNDSNNVPDLADTADSKVAV